MTASEKSLLGLGKQVAKGTIQATDANFDYMLFLDGTLGPQNSVLP